jgi:putative flavoprotein involved in K+ transport
MDATLEDLPSPLARLGANPQASGRRGGHDLHYRTLQALGVGLLGHLVGVEDGTAHFAADLLDSVAFGDARYRDICRLIAKSCDERGVDVPDMAPPPPFAASPIETLDLRGFGAAIFTSGYRPEYTGWVHLRGAFDDLGFPRQRDGSSTVIDGLHFMGVHFQRKRKSATFFGVAEDAQVLADRILAPRRST